MSANLSMPAFSNAAFPGLRYGAGAGTRVEDHDGAFPPGGAFGDDGNPVRGVLIGLLLSLPLWAVTGALGYWLFG